MEATESNVEEQPEGWVEPETVEPSDQEAERELSIGRRLGNWKSIASFAFAILVLVVVVAKAGIDPNALWHRLRTANPLYLMSAFVLYYLTFPLRGYRWKLLLQNAYADTHAQAIDDMSIRGLSEILYISWFVNCVVPAKLGDLYRAYLAKLWVHISWTKTIGTILAERLLDILVLCGLLSGTGFVLFHDKLGHIGIILVLGLCLAVVGTGLLVAMKTFSSRIRALLPARFAGRYAAFEEGALLSFKRVPLLLGLTIVIWLMEAGRLQLVFSSLNLHTSLISSIPFAPMLFFALATAVLTTLPFTPGGLGIVEAGLGSLMVYLGIPAADAAAVVLTDRIISYYSVAILGFIVYLLSKRSHFRHAI